jgi:hypothetical protein
MKVKLGFQRNTILQKLVNMPNTSIFLKYGIMNDFPTIRIYVQVITSHVFVLDQGY